MRATTITYAGEDVSAAKMEQGDVTLLYLQNTEDSSEKHVFVYDTERDEAVPFVSIDVQDSFVVVTNVPEDVAAEISDYYQETECAFSEGSIMAYQGKTDGDLTDSDASISDFYYVYGTNSRGESGWYTYDSADQTIQRSIVNMQYQENADNAEATDQADNNSVFELDSMTRMLTAGLGIVALLLLILFIVTSVRYHRLRKYLDTEEFPEDEDETEDDDLFDDDTTIGVDIVGSTVDIVDFDGDADHSVKNKKKAKKAEKEKKAEAAVKEASAPEAPVEEVPEKPAKDVSAKELFAEDDDPSEKVVSEETEKTGCGSEKNDSGSGDHDETLMMKKMSSMMRKIRKNRNRQRRKRKVPNPVKAVPGMILNFYNFYKLKGSLKTVRRIVSMIASQFFCLIGNYKDFLSNKSTSCRRCTLTREEIIASQSCSARARKMCY